MALRRTLGLLGAAVLAIAACTPPALPSPTPTTGPTGTPTTAPTASPTVAPTPSPTASPAAVCGPDSTDLKKAGRLTIGTDNPAFPPYFQGRDGGNTEPWDPEWGDPTTGTGFESAVAYAVAEQLGFTRDQVVWIVVPFTSSYAPGPKEFDFNINQVSIKTERLEGADFSAPYYFGQQAVVVAEDGPFANATTITELKTARLGAQIGTTSYDAIENVIQPTAEISVYDTNDAAIQALAEVSPPQIDGIVLDLPTAFFVVFVQTEGLKIIGQLGEDTGAQPEEWGLVMEKGSAYKSCVDQAVLALRAAGTLDALALEWLDDEDVPQLQP
jgi:polar amino acid transport system substrate-binding protein